jgi:hypothetical protein
VHFVAITNRSGARKAAKRGLPFSDSSNVSGEVVQALYQVREQASLLPAGHRSLASWDLGLGRASTHCFFGDLITRKWFDGSGRPITLREPLNSMTAWNGDHSKYTPQLYIYNYDV